MTTTATAPILTVRQISAKVHRNFKAAATAIPADVVEVIAQRAQDAIASGEPHKCTGGWIAMPFYGKHDICGLLEIASKALKSEQLKAYHAA